MANPGREACVALAAASAVDTEVYAFFYTLCVVRYGNISMRGNVSIGRPGNPEVVRKSEMRPWTSDLDMPGLEVLENFQWGNVAEDILR
jgi:hypothetical protein